MKNYKILTAVLFAALALCVTKAFAQSSGNFAAKIDTAACVVNDNTGALSGGTTVTALQTTIKTPNSKLDVNEESTTYGSWCSIVVNRVHTSVYAAFLGSDTHRHQSPRPHSGHIGWSQKFSLPGIGGR